MFNFDLIFFLYFNLIHKLIIFVNAINQLDIRKVAFSHFNNFLNTEYDLLNTIKYSLELYSLFSYSYFTSELFFNFQHNS